MVSRLFLRQNAGITILRRDNIRPRMIQRVRRNPENHFKYDFVELFKQSFIL